MRSKSARAVPSLPKMMSYSNSKYRGFCRLGRDEVSYHLFQGQTLGLGNKEVDEGSTEVREHSEENISTIRDALQHVRGDLTNAVKKEVRSLEAEGEFLHNWMSTYIKLFIQLLDAPNETPYGRVLNGQISAMMIQAQGPQL